MSTDYIVDLHKSYLISIDIKNGHILLFDGVKNFSVNLNLTFIRNKKVERIKIYKPIVLRF